jgi:hypothetical protein
MATVMERYGFFDPKIGFNEFRDMLVKLVG